MVEEDSDVFVNVSEEQPTCVAEVGKQPANAEQEIDEGTVFFLQDTETETGTLKKSLSSVENKPISKKNKKRINDAVEKKRLEQHEEAVSLAINVLKKPRTETQLDEYNAFAVTVASKLKRMTEDQRLLAEMLVNKVLFYGVKGKLTEESDITVTREPVQYSTNFGLRYNSNINNTHQTTHYQDDSCPANPSRSTSSSASYQYSPGSSSNSLWPL
ncbi:uncharacterized protein LOC124371088 [Homalodisca vitripennis]|uniref:uncharacterized protein LOC124371088 n=1 Tax=Homalodisca vitripennis TaxID=197043 RepID=UPI001EEA8E9C|nr:uncharacterized protein LOC124371088 [Homalodisca vitripennis]